MRTLGSIILFATLWGGPSAHAQDAVSAKRVPERGASVTEEPLEPDGAGPRIYPLVNASIVDRYGKAYRLVGFHRISGENRFVGYLGQADIEVPYTKIKQAAIAGAEEPGGRMRADLRLHSGKLVKATFDQREGEQLFAGYAPFGRVTVYWRDIRKLVVEARTKTTDLPTYGKATHGVDVLLKDRAGTATELIAFRRATGENYVSGLHGAARVEVPLRIVKRARFSRSDDTPLMHCHLELKDRDPLDLRMKSYEEDTVYRGRAEFGDLRIRLGQVRELTVHRSTPVLRDLDPVAAAEGREVEIGKTKRR